ncbi:GLTP1 [Symbiodinium natans]|uniref:GLTP1 protein n=1 Tax=Symbiodinium natans TaxID=878477 RepID=A0A812GIU6_9DINO|nr:GLTP1 [Symbiodinium natans]
MQDVILAKFFEACELYRDMLSKLGRAASVVVGDIEHNLGKSKAVYSEAPEERKTLLAYLQLPASHVGIEKITWLLRGVEFFLTMIKLIFTPESSGNPAVEAYQQTLMQYHGWMLQQTVKLGMRAMPSKDGIVQSEGLVLGDVSAEQRKALCERDAPVVTGDLHCAPLDMTARQERSFTVSQAKCKVQKEVNEKVTKEEEGQVAGETTNMTMYKVKEAAWKVQLKMWLAGEAVEVDDTEYRKPLDLVRQHARERWNLLPEDLIVLTCGGGTLSENSRSEDVSGDVFFFLQKCLESEVDVVPARLDPADPTLATFGGGEELDEVVGQRCVDVIDPAFEAFRSNIAEARARIAESRSVAALALRCEERVAVQRLAARAVLDNLTSHRTACSRSMSLLAQKSSRVQTRLNDSLDKVEVSMKALESVVLHAALQTQGRTTLADVMPRERIRRFTEGLEAERAQLIQRLGKLQRQDNQLQALCDQIAERVEQLIHDDGVGVEAKSIQDEQGRAQRELLPELRALVPSAGAAPSRVLEDEKRSALVLDGVKTACANVRSSLDQLQSCWDRQHQTFVQRLREVAYVQSKVRYVERQAALLEEEVNAQSNNSQQLNRLQKMPRAYNSTLREVALRRQFRARYLAQGEKALTTLSRMVEVENSRRRTFLQRYSCYLPTDFVQGLGTLAPLATVEVPDFDSQLPEIDMAYAEVGSSGPALEASGQHAASVASSSPLSANASSSAVANSTSELPRAEPSEIVSKALAEDPPEESEETANKEDALARIAELEARNKALEEQLEILRQEQAARGASEAENFQQ